MSELSSKPKKIDNVCNTLGVGGVSWSMSATMNPGGDDLLRELQWLRTFTQRLAGPADVDDLVQDTLAAAWRAAPDRDDGRSLRPWLARVVRNRAYNAARGRMRRQRREALASEAAPASSPEADLERIALLKRLIELIEALPDVDQRIITKRFADNANATEIGEALGLEPATVRSRLKRALTRLRKDLDGHYGGRASGAALAGAWPIERTAPAVAASSGTGAAIGALTGALGAGALAIWIWPVADQRPADGAVALSIGNSVGDSIADTVEVVPTSKAAAEQAPRPAAQDRWEASRLAILAAKAEPVEPGTEAAPLSDSLLAFSASQQEAFDGCVRDLGLEAGEHFTIESEVIGAPGVGTIVSDVRVADEVEVREELLTCLTESMYTLDGPAPPRFFETTMSFAWGPPPEAPPPRSIPMPTTLDLDQLAYVDARRKALASTLAECRPEASDADGTASLRLVLGENGAVKKVRFAETTLGLDVVDCIADVMIQQWTFDALPADTVLAIDAELPEA